MQAEEPIPTIADRMCNIASEIKLTKRKEGKKVRLLAVSKFQGISKIVSAFEAGQHHFGENYIEELATKSRELSGIKWHMIGHIQKNKIGRLLNVEGLYMIESLDSIKLAKGLEKGLNKFGIDVEGVINRLKVLIQINISGEKQKSGIGLEEAIPISKYIIEECPHLQFSGIMSMGTANNTTEFQTIFAKRREIADYFELDENELELSMGTTVDYKLAIEEGATEVRIGTSFFGPREYPKDPVVVKVDVV